MRRLAVAVVALSAVCAVAAGQPFIDSPAPSPAYAPSADPCTWPAGEVRLLRDMYACFTRVPYSADVNNNTATSLLRAMELYAFKDIASSPPPESEGFELQAVDISAEVARVAGTAYSSDYAMQADYSQIFRRLQDAHTRYKLPANYKLFAAGIPLHFISAAAADGTAGKLDVRVSPFPVPEAAVERMRPFMSDADQLPAFANATVLSVDGGDPTEAFVAFANASIGLSKDLNTRLNLAFNAYEPSPTSVLDPPQELAGLFSLRHGDFAPFPPPSERDVRVSLRLVNGTVTNVTVPWVAVATGTVSDTAGFLSAWRAGGSPQAREENDDDIFARRRRPLAAAPAPPAPAALDGSGACTGSLFCLEMLASSPSVRVYRIAGDTDTAILYMNTFGPEDESLFAATVQKGLDAATALGLSRLIIDATGNGGGDICLGRRMLQLIYGADFAPPTDMPRSLLSDTMARNAPRLNLSNCVWCADEYAPDDPSKSFDPGSPAWMLDGPDHVRGGRRRAYSQLLHLSPLACSYDPDVPVNRYNFTDTMVVTRGECGSTCAFFAQHARFYFGVKQVAVGGLPGRPMDCNSFPGLQVLDTPFLWSEIESHEVGDGLAPPRLMTSAQYRLCDREVYPHPGSSVPTEYTFVPADFRIQNTFDNVLRPELAWFDVVKLF